MIWITFSPDGKKLAMVSIVTEGQGRRVSEVTLLDLKNAKALWTKTADQGYYTVAFSPDGRTLAAANGEVHLLDCETGAITKSFAVKDRKALRVEFSPDGKTLAAGGGYWIDVGGGTQQVSEVYLWDAQSGELLRKITDLDTWLRCIAFSPNGKILATGTSGPILTKGNVTYVTSEIRLWEPQTGKLVRSIAGEVADTHSLAFSPDGKSLLSCDGEAVVLTETLTGLRRLELMKRTLKPFPEK
jgi:WD40 repeat protein